MPLTTRRMRLLVIGAVWVFLGACESGSSAPPPAATPRPSPARTIPLPHGPALGIGEPRNPQPYTIDQRLLDAASHADRRTIELALQRGAHLGAKDDIGRSVVLRAVLDAGDLDLVRWLHAKGAALDEPDGGGRTALSFAAENGRLDIVRYLVENGASVDRVDVQRRTPLFEAVLGDHRDVVSFLLDRGAAVNTRDQFGDTPLIVACAKGYGEMATLLLQRGADPTLKDQEGRTARERAAAGTAACLGPPPGTPSPP
jgi:ankyrin repeat protein